MTAASGGVAVGRGRVFGGCWGRGSVNRPSRMLEGCAPHGDSPQLCIPGAKRRDPAAIIHVI